MKTNWPDPSTVKFDDGEKAITDIRGFRFWLPLMGWGFIGAVYWEDFVSYGLFWLEEI